MRRQISMLLRPQSMTPAMLSRRALKYDGLRELRYIRSLAQRETRVVTNHRPVGRELIGTGMGTKLFRARATFHTCQAVVICGCAQGLGYPRVVRGLLRSGIPSYER